MLARPGKSGIPPGPALRVCMPPGRARRMEINASVVWKGVHSTPYVQGPASREAYYPQVVASPWSPWSSWSSLFRPFILFIPVLFYFSLLFLG